jgi:hypothetical protein
MLSNAFNPVILGRFFIFFEILKMVHLKFKNNNLRKKINWLPLIAALLLVLLRVLKPMHKSILEKGYWEPCKSYSRDFIFSDADAAALSKAASR